MKKVTAGCGAFVEPTLRPSVLTVPAVAVLFVFATNSTTRTVLDIRIDVPNLAVGLTIGVGKGIDQTIIADHMVAFDDIVQSSLQLIPGLTCGVVVVIVGNLGHNAATYCKEQQWQQDTGKCVLSHGHIIIY